MNGTHTHIHAAAPGARRVCACLWQHGAKVCGVISTTGVCASIESDVLRTMKGDYGSSG